jgi:ubiquinone/menaquinone biosynthesis C-methylase UbiE
MEVNNQKPVYTPDGRDTAPTFLDIQAEVGISKHFGGYAATDILHQRCHLEEVHEVLEVGCGTGVGSVYIAKRYQSRVVAVDISDKMLSWARERALREGVAERVTFKNADVLELPFEEGRFDVVIVESVLAFVKEKETAIRELFRVTKPGGYLGLNEYCWRNEPPADVLAQSVFIGMATITIEEWQRLWEASGLTERWSKTYTVEPRQEFRDRIDWVGGWRSIFKIWGRVIKLLLSNPKARDAVKQQLDLPAEVADAMGYILLTGRKP